MNTEIIIGIIVVTLSLSITTAITVWACKSIDRLAENGYKTARETLKDLSRGKRTNQ